MLGQIGFPVIDWGTATKKGGSTLCKLRQERVEGQIEKTRLKNAYPLRKIKMKGAPAAHAILRRLGTRKGEFPKECPDDKTANQEKNPIKKKGGTKGIENKLGGRPGVRRHVNRAGVMGGFLTTGKKRSKTVEIY